MSSTERIEVESDRDPDVAEALTIIRRYVPVSLARLWLFGSRARGDHRRWSDIDVAVDPVGPLPAGWLADVRDALAESNLLLDVDLVDLSEAGDALAAVIRREAVPWNA